MELKSFSLSEIRRFTCRRADALFFLSPFADLQHHLWRPGNWWCAVTKAVVKPDVWTLQAATWPSTNKEESSIQHIWRAPIQECCLVFLAGILF